MIPVLVFLMLELQVTGTRGAVSVWGLAVREGNEVTLPCLNECNTTIWSFSGSNVLFNGGQKKKSTSDRVSLNANCSLVINKVTPEDAGSYTCKVPDYTGRTPGSVVYISLSVVVMTEQKNGDRVTLSCSVSTPQKCEQVTVTLFHKSIDISGDHPYIRKSLALCSSTVTILNLTYSNISSYDFVCVVGIFKLQDFVFSPHSSDEETTSENNTNAVTEQKNADSLTLNSSVLTPGKCEEEVVKWIYKSTVWWRFIAVAVVLAALITAVVIINIWTKAGEKTQRDETMVFNEEDGAAVKNENVQSSDEV